MELSITQPDDWHLHLRDGDLLKAIVPHSSLTKAGILRRKSFWKGHCNAKSDEIKLARKSGVVFAVKLYPADATTNSQDGVSDLLGKCLPVLEDMVEQNMPLLVHGEVTNSDVDIFDREKVFIDTILRPLLQKLPRLKVVMEHITTQDAVRFVETCHGGSVAATVTPQHLLLNRIALFQGGLQPHNYCLPVLKREIHRQAIVSAVTSGNKRFFLGTDSTPHESQRKESTCGCAGIYNAPVALAAYAKVFEEVVCIEGP